jgi:hypothetical protein
MSRQKSKPTLDDFIVNREKEKNYVKFGLPCWSPNP